MQKRKAMQRQVLRTNWSPDRLFCQCRVSISVSKPHKVRQWTTNFEALNLALHRSNRQTLPNTRTILGPQNPPAGTFMTWLRNFESADFETVSLRLHEQIKHALFALILTQSLCTDPKFEQVLATLFAHVNLT